MVLQAKTSEGIGAFLCVAVAMMCRVWSSVKLVQLYVVTGYKSPINPIINPNPVTSHKHVTIYMYICPLPLSAT
jgi:hypothetical protein